MKIFALAGALLLALVWVPRVPGLITVSYDGRVISSSGTLFGLTFSAGDPVSVILKYDETVADTDPLPSWGSFPQTVVNGMDVTIDGHTFTSSDFRILQGTSGDPNDFTAVVNMDLSTGSMTVDGAPVTRGFFAIDFSDYSPYTQIPSANTPLAPFPSTDSWDSVGGRIQDNTQLSARLSWGVITPTPSATPSPTLTPTPSPTPSPSTTPTLTLTPSPEPAPIAVWGESSGKWMIHYGPGRTPDEFHFGGPGDIPSLGAYGGDGISNPAIFRSSTGFWAVKDVTCFYYGKTGDLPVPADYDGDGVADPGIFRPSTGLWAVAGVDPGLLRPFRRHPPPRGLRR